VEVLSQLGSNNVLWVSIVSWCIAQLLKVIFTVLKYKKLDFSRLVGSGGMPSSHSSFVMALAVGVGKVSGFDTPIFAFAIVFAFVVMYDASGVRRAAGKQAEILNKIIEEMKHQQFNLDGKLKELLGHTPKEVFAGAILGIIIASIMV